MKTPEPYVGTYTLEEWRGVTLQGDATVTYLPPGSPRRPSFDPEPERALIRVALHNGSLHRHTASRHDEGISYEQEIVTLDEHDGEPAWIIESEDGGTDCDGAHAHRWKGYSLGGLTEGGWHSLSTQIDACFYDRRARMAGY